MGSLGQGSCVYDMPVISSQVQLVGSDPHKLFCPEVPIASIVIIVIEFYCPLVAGQVLFEINRSMHIDRPIFPAGSNAYGWRVVDRYGDRNTTPLAE